MEVLNLKIDDIKPYENNPRNNLDAIDATANSIKEFGWRQPIVVDKDKVIVAGHTRYYAAKKLGYDVVPVVDASDLSDEQIRAYRLADNKTGELADWDLDMLDIELDDINDIDMSDFGFEEEIDIFDGEEKPAYDSSNGEKGSLARDFIVPPFSIIDFSKQEFIQRKNNWNDKIQDHAKARSGATTYTTDHLEGNGSNDETGGVSLLNPALCEVICKWFLPQQGKTFDCFAGDTAFGFVSSYLGNEFTGIELRKEQVEFNQSRVDEFGLNAKYICDDGQNVAKHIPAESQDLLFSCPPYFDLEVYSDDPNDASNQDSYEDFIKILRNAFTNAVDRLKDNRFACIVIGEIRDKNGFYYSFGRDIVEIFEDAGMHLYNDIVLKTPIGTGAIRARNNMKNRKVVTIHQKLLVFYKGNNPGRDIQKEFAVIDFPESEEV